MSSQTSSQKCGKMDIQLGNIMTPADFIAARTASGDSTTAAVRALADVLCIKERRAWLLYTGEAKATQAQLLLLTIWNNEPSFRHYWKKDSQQAISESKLRAKS